MPRAGKKLQAFMTDPMQAHNQEVFTMPDNEKIETPSDINRQARTVTLIDNSSGERYTFPVLDGAIGPRVIDIRKLYAETGCFTYDPAFTSTASCESQITYIDGDRGILLHRGYPIEQLATHSDFPEVCYLLLHGE